MPTTRSSTSNSALFADASTSFDLPDESSIASNPLDVCDLKALMLSNQANQRTIESINSRTFHFFGVHDQNIDRPG